MLCQRPKNVAQRFDEAQRLITDFALKGERLIVLDLALVPHVPEVIAAYFPGAKSQTVAIMLLFFCWALVVVSATR
jgi:hypothetical protein